MYVHVIIVYPGSIDTWPYMYPSIGYSSYAIEKRYEYCTYIFVCQLPICSDLVARLWIEHFWSMTCFKMYVLLATKLKSDCDKKITTSNC